MAKPHTGHSTQRRLHVESLETRLAPATLVDPSTATYQDVDGDTVTVRLTKPLLNAVNVNNVFTFDAGSVNGDNSTKQELRHIDLLSFAAAGNGIGIVVTAVRTNAGDGFANVGTISGWDLGAVSVKGDLGGIEAGDPDTKTVALASLSVQSMGRATAALSSVMGRVGSISVKSDWVDAYLQTFGTGAVDDFHATIGSITVGGSYFGSISAGGDIGIVKIGGDIVGGAYNSTGRISSGGKLSSLTVGGSLIGGGGEQSGTVESIGAMGPVNITGDIRGGAGVASGSVLGQAEISGVTVGGSVVGGSGGQVARGDQYLGAGSVVSNRMIDTIKVAGDVRGGAGVNSGEIEASHIGNVQIGGSVFSDTGLSGVIIATGTLNPTILYDGTIGQVRIGGDLDGGKVRSIGSIAGVTVGGSLAASKVPAAQSGGYIETTGADLGPVRIGRDIVGGAGNGTGAIIGGGKLASVRVGGSVIGGSGQQSGAVSSGGDIGPVTIAGDLRGGAGAASGSIVGRANVARVTLGGSLVGGSGNYVRIGDDLLGAGSILIQGRLGPLKIARDLQGGTGDVSANVQAARIDRVMVGGSLVAGTGTPVIVAVGTDDAGGDPRYDGSIGPVQVAGSIDAGDITCLGTVASLTVGGSVTGTDTAILVAGDLGPVSVAGDIRDAQIHAIRMGKIVSVTVGGSIVGGDTGDVFILTNDNGTKVYAGPGRVSGNMGIGKVTIGGDLVGGARDGSGTVEGIYGPVGPVLIGGSVRGGAGQQSGAVFSSSTLRAVTVGGSVTGGAGIESGEVITDPLGTGAMGPVAVGGSLVGGAGEKSGRVFSAGHMGPVKIAADLRGGTGMNSGNLLSAKNLGGVTLGGSLVGGGKLAGLINAANIGAVRIAGSIRGGSGTLSGRVFSVGDITAVTVGGSVIGGSKDETGSIRSNGNMGPVQIGGDLIGGDAQVNGVEGTGYIQGERIARVTIGGSVRAGTNDFFDPVTNFLKKSGTIRAVNDLGPVAIKGSLIGSKSPAYGNITPVIISARGQATPTATTDLAIASLTIGGRVERANILAGYDADLNPVNADAQIGAVHIGGDWIASNLVAGVDAGSDGLFGTDDDVLINEAGQSPTTTARLGDVRIDGQVIGTNAGVDPNDHYGFVAQLVQTFTVGGTALPAAAGPANDDIALGATGDVRVLEVAA